MLIQFIIGLTATNRSHRANIQLGVLLALTAGAVNAGGFLALGIYTSHMSGMASMVGDAAALENWQLMKWTAIFITCFIGGAMLCSIMIQAALASKLQKIYVLPLLLEALGLMIFYLCITKCMHLPKLHSSVLEMGSAIAFLCAIMGLQNAMVTKISNAVIRTTHVTGISTDIGIEMGRFIASKCFPARKVSFDAEKLGNLVKLLLSFIVGGVLGAVGFIHIGPALWLIISLVLAVVALVPYLCRQTYCQL